ncbi:MAG: flagellar biosynthesis protein FlaG [Desulfobulbaceae bacterium]|nr:MAG: flagellar biosynthesis protein FlaG [Desulfobulbaceae bacterium]
MVDVNISTEIKGAGQPLVSSVEIEDQTRPRVAPVGKGEKSAQGELNDQALHGRKAGKLSADDLRDLTEEIQDRFEAMGAKLGFSVHEATEDIVVEVTERESGELIRQIPSEEVLALREKLNELVGLLFDKQA